MPDDKLGALIVIDVQNDFCPGGALAVKGGDQIVPMLNSLLPRFEAKVFTQDWHPSDHCSFASSHREMEPFSVTSMPYGQQVLWPDHCIQGTRGADFFEGLDVDQADLIIRKGFRTNVDSYSAFFENDRTTPTGLQGYLETRDISSIVCVGLATDYCVCYSALDARRLGFEVTVLEDACRAIDLEGSLEKARSQMRGAGVVLSSANELLED